MKLNKHFIFMLLVSLSVMYSSVTASEFSDLDAYNVVWDSPSGDMGGSMPLGNGDIGTNVWMEENGDLVFYISKTDSWGDNGRLLKVGRVRLSLSPNPLEGTIDFSLLGTGVGTRRFISSLPGNPGNYP